MRCVGQITVKVYLESKEVIHSADDDVDAGCASCLCPQVVLKICGNRIIQLAKSVLMEFIVDLISVQLESETSLVPTIIVTFTEELQETEQVTSELIVRHDFLIFRGKINTNKCIKQRPGIHLDY